MSASGPDRDGGVGYQPMAIARLGELLATCAENERWLMIAEFLEEHRHEPRQRRLDLLQQEPEPTGDERWDVFLAALAEHLAAKDGRRGPRWCEQRHLRQFWFPFNTKAARAGDRACPGCVPAPRCHAHPERAGSGVTEAPPRVPRSSRMSRSRNGPSCSSRTCSRAEILGSVAAHHAQARKVPGRGCMSGAS